MRVVSGLIILMFLLSSPLWSQEPREQDQEFWTGVTGRLHLHKRWRVELEQQLRLNQNWSEFKLSFTEAGVRYEITRRLDVKLLYRFTVIGNDFNEQRWSLDFRYEYDIPDIPLDIIYRLRLQDEKVSYTGQKITQWRNRIGLDYNLTKLVDPFVEYESFYRFNDKQEFRTDRFTFGLEWKLNKRWDLESFYRLDREKNVEIPESQYIVGLRLTYTGRVY